MGDYPAIVLLGVLALFLLSAGIEDVRTREIANWKTAAVALLAPAWWWAIGLAPWPDMAMQIGIGAIVFSLFLGAYAAGLMGGGDVKLIGALALWLPLQSFAIAFMWMALIGGALTAAMVVDEWVRRRAALPRPDSIGVAVAVLVALGISALATPASGGWLLARPLLWLTAMIAILSGIAALLMFATRAARRRGIVPETPYGVAIAVAGLLAIREPIINQFG